MNVFLPERKLGVHDVNLDATDIRILSAVQKHGLLSKSRLAEVVNLSPTPCWKRLNRLKSAGYINGTHADIAIEKLGDFTEVIVTVSLKHHGKTDFNRFETYISNLDEVTDCIATGGGMDYVMRCYAPNIRDFERLMSDLLDADLGIDRYMTYFATRQIKSSQPNLSKLVFRSSA